MSSARLRAELRQLRETVLQDAEGKGSPPPARHKWADIALLEPVRDYKARHASTMLTFDAVVDAIGQIEANAISLRQCSLIAVSDGAGIVDRSGSRSRVPE